MLDTGYTFLECQLEMSSGSFPQSPLPHPTANSATYCPTADKDLVLSADLWQDPESPFKGMGIRMYPLLYNSPFLSLKLLLCPGHIPAAARVPSPPRLSQEGLALL